MTSIYTEDTSRVLVSVRLRTGMAGTVNSLSDDQHADTAEPASPLPEIFTAGPEQVMR